MTQATRSSLMSVDTTLSANIDATQNYIPVASTTNFSTSVVAEIETTNEVVSFTDISENNFKQSQTFDNGYWQKLDQRLQQMQLPPPMVLQQQSNLLKLQVKQVMV